MKIPLLASSAFESFMERQAVSKDNVQRHRERRQPLGHRDHEQPQVSSRTLPPRHHGEPGDDEDRGGAAEVGYLKSLHANAMQTLPQLSPRSIRVLQLIANGHGYAQILSACPEISWADIFEAAAEAIRLDQPDEKLPEDTGIEAKYPPPPHRLQKRHARKYEPWSAAEDRDLETMHAKGSTKAEMADILHRQTSAISHRLRTLGLIA